MSRTAASSPTCGPTTTRGSAATYLAKSRWRSWAGSLPTGSGGMAHVVYRALPGFVWVEVETPAVEVDGRLEVLGVAEAPGGLLDPLDDGVDPLEARIGQVMAQVGEQVRQMALDQLGDGRHRLEAAMGRAPVPAGEEGPGRPRIAVLPEGAEALLQRPGPPDLEVFPLRGPEDQALFRQQVRGPAQPQIFGPRESLIAVALEGPVLAASHAIDGLVQVLDHMELVEHDLGVRLGQVRPRRLHVGLPHVHGDGGDTVALGGRQGGPEAVQTFLLAVVGQVEHPALRQIGHDGQVAMPLGDGLLVDPEPRDHVVAPARQAPLDCPPLDPPALVPADA